VHVCLEGMMLLLGAVLSCGPGKGRLPAKTIIGVVVLRLLVMPTLGGCPFLLVHPSAVGVAGGVAGFLCLSVRPSVALSV
jgi:hypothetical protein